MKAFLSFIQCIFSNTDHMPNFGLVPEDMGRNQTLSCPPGAQRLVEKKEQALLCSFKFESDRRSIRPKS